MIKFNQQHTMLKLFLVHFAPEPVFFTDVLYAQSNIRADTACDYMRSSCRLRSYFFITDCISILISLNLLFLKVCLRPLCPKIYPFLQHALSHHVSTERCGTAAATTELYLLSVRGMPFGKCIRRYDECKLTIIWDKVNRAASTLALQNRFQSRITFSCDRQFYLRHPKTTVRIVNLVYKLVFK